MYYMSNCAFYNKWWMKCVYVNIVVFLIELNFSFDIKFYSDECKCTKYLVHT